MSPADSKGPVVGHFEVLPEKFSELTVDRLSDVVFLDLKEALPDFVSSGGMLSPLIERVWRRGCDEIITAERGIYAHKPGATKVELFFHGLTDVMAKVKVSLIVARMKELLKQVEVDESVLDSPLPTIVRRAAQTEQKSAKQEAMELLKEGLPENPTADLVRLWVFRETQDMLLLKQKIPMTREMALLTAKIDIAYQPLYMPQAQTVVGSVGCIKVPFPESQWKDGEIFRQDIALLFNATMRLYALIVKKQASIVVLPVRLATLLDKDVAELYQKFLRLLPPEVQSNIILEIRQVPKDLFSEAQVAALESVRPYVKAFIFETSPLVYTDYRKKFPTLHATGFEVSGMFVKLPASEQARLIKKYADFTSGLSLKSYIKDVRAPQIFKLAVEAKFSYVAGSAVLPEQKTCFLTQKVPLPSFA